MRIEKTHRVPNVVCYSRHLNSPLFNEKNPHGEERKLVEVRKQTMPTEEHDCLDLHEYAMQYASALAAIKECMFRVEMQINDPPVPNERGV